VSPASPRPAGSTAAAVLALLLAILLLVVPGLPPGTARGESVPNHLVVSEVVTGGASASDELIELYNPTAAAVPLEGLELVYVTASGATISRRAAWELGAPSLGPGRHLLIANELGVYAGIADALYASGMAGTGGSVALRIQGASSAIDAVGWGTAASTWLEGQVAGAPPSGSSLERLPGGDAGSTQDTDDNGADFVVRAVPEPQNLGSPPVPDPSATPAPTAVPSSEPSVPPPSATPTPTPIATSVSSPDPSGEVVSIATARALPDGTEATIEGVALTESAFGDGGGYVADTSGGIAVIVTGATFERGERLRLSGDIDDRFAQRTLRVEAADLTRLGTSPEPSPPIPTKTGAIAESLEGVLVRVAGTIVGTGSTLTTGVAFDLDDGSGAVRLVVGISTGIDVAAWEDDTVLELVGVVGQRDATGSGISGYRVQPRDIADILSVGAPPSPTPEPSDDPTPSPTLGGEPGIGVISIADARELPKNARARVRGTVTLEPGIVDPATAVIQDGSGAIVLRLSDEAGTLSRGDLVEVDGVRSTKSGMETLRVTTPATRIGSGPSLTPRELRTGDAGEANEARLVLVRGAVVAAARRSSSGSLSFELDDGSGALRVSVGASIGADPATMPEGTWVEVIGVLGQETSGSQPLRGYRIWPRAGSDMRIVAAATGTEGSGEASGGGAGPAGSLETIGGAADDAHRVGATLVLGPWPELGIGGLLWDGTRLAALEASAATSVEAVRDGQRLPLVVEAAGLRAAGTHDGLGIPMVRLGGGPDALVAGSGTAAPPAELLAADRGRARWVAAVGRLTGGDDAHRLALTAGRRVTAELRCADASLVAKGIVGVVGVALPDPPRLIIPCGGIRPAPVLERAAALADARPPTGVARLAGLPGEDGSLTTPAPVGPAAILGLAAVALLGGAVIARRIGAGGPDPDHEGTDASAGADEEPSPPVLTLVPMPRERAP
jgi:hypothetical protein